MNHSRRAFFLAAVVGAAAWALGFCAQWRCRFAQFTERSDRAGKNASRPIAQPVTIRVGMWHRESFETVHAADADGDGDDENLFYPTCVRYPDGTDVDPRWKAARTFAVLSGLTGMVSLMTNAVACCSRPDPTKAVVGPGYVVAATFEGLTLLFLDGNACNGNILTTNEDERYLEDLRFPDECALGPGAKCAIAATALYVAAAATCCWARATERAEETEAGRPEGRRGRFSELREPFVSERSKASIFRPW